MDNSEFPENCIAIIGMAGRFPGAKNIQQFWDNLCRGVESISRFSIEDLKDAEHASVINDSNYVKARGILEAIELFDADFFGFTEKEAQITDPQQRVFLECAWEALEDAGYYSDNYSGLIGVYGGTSMSSYFLNNIYPNQKLRDSLGEYLVHVNNDKDYLATRVAYKLNLKGPSLNIQTACSTSLVTINLACNQLLTYQCDMALAGGVSISIPEKRGYIYQEGMIFSPDGHCKPFDAQAHGTVPGNGAGIIVLKRLQEAVQDGDHIYAIIRGYGINNDGSEKIGYSAPSIEGQAEVITSAIAMADVNPETITFVEAHGTGTLLGDPIEVKALKQAFERFTQKKNYCAIGSSKGNVGHLIEAAGVAGIIKTSLALHHQLIPPTLHYNTPNPHIDFTDSPFYVNKELRVWDTDEIPRRASVSSFGIGGTNAHAVLEESPRLDRAPPLPQPQLILLSAKSPTALNVMMENLGKHLQKNPTLSVADIAYTLQIGRKVFAHKQFFISNSVKEIENSLAQALSSSSLSKSQISERENCSLIFMCGDLKLPYINVGKDLYNYESIYQEAIDNCSHLLKDQIGIDLRNILYPTPDQKKFAATYLQQPLIAQCALFTTQFALAKLWQQWGIHPQAVLGYGIGSYVAACLAGITTLKETLYLITQMEKVKGIVDAKEKQGEFDKILQRIQLKSPTISFFSNAKGAWIPAGTMVSSDCLLPSSQRSENLVNNLRELGMDSNHIFIELGPGTVLCESIGAYKPAIMAFPSLPNSNQAATEREVLLNTLGHLWCCGCKINWAGVHKNRQPHRVSLPTYPFERKRYWIDPPNLKLNVPDQSSPKIAVTTPNSLPAIEKELMAIWKDLLGTASIKLNDDFYALGGDSILAIQIISQIQTHFGVSLKIQSLMEFPTIALLAKVIHQNLASPLPLPKDSPLPPNIVALRSGTLDQPLFFIHPIGGSVFCYKDLVEKIQHPGVIYGIQSSYFDTEEPSSFKSIQELASDYIISIRTLQRKGPYRVLGSSFGGLIAYEIARQLQDSGHTVALLAMLDIVRPDDPSQKFNTNADMLSLLIELFGGTSITLHQLKTLSSEDQIKKLMDSMGLGMLSFSRQQSIFMQIQMYCQALINYHPKPYTGKIVFFEAKERFSRNEGISLGNTWKTLAEQGIDIHETSGNHFTMILSPHVSILANILNTYL